MFLVGVEEVELDMIQFSVRPVGSVDLLVGGRGYIDRDVNLGEKE